MSRKNLLKLHYLVLQRNATIVLPPSGILTELSVRGTVTYRSESSFSRINWLLTCRPVLCPHIESVHEEAVADSFHFRYLAQRN